MVTTEKLKTMFEKSLIELTEIKLPNSKEWVYPCSKAQADFMVFCKGVDAGMEINE